MDLMLVVVNALIKMEAGQIYSCVYTNPGSANRNQYTVMCDLGQLVFFINNGTVLIDVVGIGGREPAGTAKFDKNGEITKLTNVLQAKKDRQE